MCSDEQHKEHMAALGRIEKLLEFQVKGRPFLDTTYVISDTQGFHLDYKDRKHLYLYSQNPIVLNVQTYGTVDVSANAWTPLEYEAGFKLFTIGTSSPVSVQVRATDEKVV